MKITQPGRDIIRVTEEDYENGEVVSSEDKVHLIKFAFEEPDNDKVNWVFETYPDTKRFVVEQDIKFYNDILKKTNKKYYVENSNNTSLITFFRKNNKVLLNFSKLFSEERDFILEYLLNDILKNVEIIAIDKDNFERYFETFRKWKGNVVIDNNYEL